MNSYNFLIYEAGLLRTCRADITEGSRLQRCGRRTLRGATVCARHLDLHETFLPAFVAEWARRWAGR
jgi:hypothetical protein